MAARMSELPAYWFGAPPELRDGEQWVAHHPANRTQGKRAVGGGLHFTTQRLLNGFIRLYTATRQAPVVAQPGISIFDQQELPLMLHDRVNRHAHFYQPLLKCITIVN